MALIGKTYKRTDGLYESRITSTNHRLVGTSGNQGYKRRRPALVTLEHLLVNGPHIVLDVDGHVVGASPEQVTSYAPPRLFNFFRRRPSRPYTGQVYQRVDGRYEWRITAPNGKIVFVSHSQGYEQPGRVSVDGAVKNGALKTLVEVCHGGPHTVEFE